MTYTVASFFSGIGGLDLAFAWAGFDIRFQCEIDPYCQQVLKKWRPVYWQNAVVKGDIHEVTKREVGKVDVIVGGFPCQDISIAGKREGIRRGNRSGLWFELLRIIGEVRPCVVLLENVAAIAVPVDGQPAPGLIVTATLAEIGYDCQWQFVRAADVGAPHQRERWFCIAYDMGDGQSILSKWHITSRNPGRQSTLSARNRSGVERNELSNATHKRLTRRFGQPRNAAFRGYAARRRQRIVSNGGIAIMGDTNGNGLQGRQKTRNLTPGEQNRSKRTSRPGYGTGKQLRAQSRLGRVAHGLSRRLDRHNGQFPARPNESQFDYEPSRVTDVKENRVARIKALGNAVVPQVVYPFAVAIKQFLESVPA